MARGGQAQFWWQLFMVTGSVLAYVWYRQAMAAGMTEESTTTAARQGGGTTD